MNWRNFLAELKRRNVYRWLWLPHDYSRKARQHPAFQGLTKRIGLVDYWKQNRLRDLCQPAPERGPDTFTCK